MSLNKVVVAGGTGFLGRRLVSALVADGATVTVLTRSEKPARHFSPSVSVQTWEPGAFANTAELEKALSDADLVVNLCGAPVIAKWTEGQMKLIRGSRVQSTSTIVRVIAEMPLSLRPRCVVNASGVSFYGKSESAIFDEADSGDSKEFLASVFHASERAAAPLADLAGTRLVILRIGVVLGVGGGPIARMLSSFQKGIGGPVGSGSQWMSWIHIDDLVAMMIAAGKSHSVVGIYNSTAPNPVTMTDFSATLARAVGKTNNSPVPSAVIEQEYGQASSVILKGQRVLPKKWLRYGFVFKHTSIGSALDAILKEASIIATEDSEERGINPKQKLPEKN